MNAAWRSIHPSREFTEPAALRRTTYGRPIVNAVSSVSPLTSSPSRRFGAPPIDGLARAGRLASMRPEHGAPFSRDDRLTCRLTGAATAGYPLDTDGEPALSHRESSASSSSLGTPRTRELATGAQTGRTLRSAA